MKERIEAFLADVDATLTPLADGAEIKIHPIGRSALVWHYDYLATTQDIDILQPHDIDPQLLSALLQFGRDTAKAALHGLYLELVSEAFPPVPSGYQKRATSVAGPWTVLRVFRLDPHDLAATKLRRFAPKDRADIRLLCDLGHLNPDQLEQVLEKAFLFNLEKDGDEYRDGPFRNLRVVQRYLRDEIKEF